MKVLNITLLLMISLVACLSYGQIEELEVSFDAKNTCTIDFQPSTGPGDLEAFAKCFIRNNELATAQNKVQVKKIDFSKLPIRIDPQVQFPSIYNSTPPIFLNLGTYENSYLDAKINHLAFFEATENTVLSSAFVIYPGIPQF
ncbi:hypothetical protein [Nonlabens xiamenensis]|uniref:hypothetical protein n=1 Tax=Nonlabens xiamenensis TaxID=2341043 RepID=UPI000F611B06|nr:hypothetical protein [Nonlabens xiamenensis]